MCRRALLAKPVCQLQSAVLAGTSSIGYAIQCLPGSVPARSWAPCAIYSIVDGTYQLYTASSVIACWQ
jgi:hypothetical protein